MRFSKGEWGLFGAALCALVACGDDDSSTTDGGLDDLSTPMTDGGPEADAGPDTTPPAFGDSMLVATAVTSDRVDLSWDAATDPSGVAEYTLLRDGATLGTTAGTTYTDDTVSADTTYLYELRATDNAGNTTTDGPSLTVMTVFVTPDPETIAPSLDPESYPDFADRVSFLWESDPPVQTDVADGFLEPYRLIVLTGRVLDEAGDPIAGATVRVLDQAGAGKTTTRADGRFDFVANGGGRTTVTLEAEGRLTAHRWLMTRHEAFHDIGDVVLIQPSTVATEVTFGDADAQLAQSETVTDPSGERTPTVIFPPGVSAQAELPDGSLVDLSAGTVRITEYSVGDGEEGMRRMPANFSAAIAYTHCVELAVDEADAMGAETVRFDAPVYYYVDNFLGFGVGDVVPMGSYDRQLGQWVAGENGRVIEVLSVTDGLADVDADGDGAAEDATALTALGFTNAERTRLGEMASAGDSFWRAPVEHFSPHDPNWSVGIPDGAVGPEAEAEDPDTSANPCKQDGSEIWCQDRALGERIEIPGTPVELVYNSLRSPDNVAQRTFEMVVMREVPDVPPKRIGIRTSVMGQLDVQTRFPVPNMRYRFVWDGQDSYGRDVYGAVRGIVEIRHFYDARYIGMFGTAMDDERRIFARQLSDELEYVDDRAEIAFVQRIPFVVTRHPERQSAALGSWTIDGHHQQDPVSGAIFFGDGTVRPSEAGIERVSDDVPVEDVAPDGSIYGIVDDQIWRVDRDGVRTLVAGNGTRGFDRSGVATDAEIWPNNVAVGNRGEVFFDQWSDSSLGEDPLAYRIMMVTPEGQLELYAGSGAQQFDDAGNPLVDGLPNTEASFPTVQDLAFGPDGLLYVYGLSYIAVIHADGQVELRKGLGGNWADDQIVGSSASFYRPSGDVLRIDDEGRLYFTGVWRNAGTRIGEKMMRMDRDQLRALSGGFVAERTFGMTLYDSSLATEAMAPAPFGLLFAHPCGLYAADERLRMVPFNAAMVDTSESCPSFDPGGDGGPVSFAKIRGVPLNGRDGNTYIADGGTRRIVYEPRGLNSVLSEDGLERWVFDNAGRHIETWDGVRDTLVATYGYTGTDLTTITDRRGLVTTIERAGDGMPMAIVGPDGTRTTLTTDGSGELTGLTLPAGGAYTMGYDTPRLLTRFVEPSGREATMSYGAEGHLESETVDGLTATLAASSIAGGKRVTFTDRSGRVTTYDITTPVGGDTVRTTVSTEGRGTLTQTHAQVGDELTTLPSGATLQVSHSSSPRPNVRHVESLDIATPGGLQRSETYATTVTLDDPADTLSPVETLRVERAVNGDTTVTEWSSTARTLTRTEATGETSVTTFSGGLPTTLARSGIATLNVTWDSEARPMSFVRGSSTVGVSYDDGARSRTITDAEGNPWSQTLDALGNVASVTAPGGQTTSFTHDATGRLLSVQAPSGDTTMLDRDLQSRAIAGLTRPSGAMWRWMRNADGSPITVASPSGAVSTTTRDGVGRVASQTGPVVTRSYTYAGDDTRYATAGWANGTEGDTLAFTNDAMLVTTVTHTVDTTDGPIVGTLAMRYDDKLDLVGTTFGTDAEVPIARDASRRRVGHGPYTWARMGPFGMPSAAAGGALTVGYGYDANGELTDKSYSVGTFTYDLAMTRDLVGRIASATETGAGSLNRSFGRNGNGWLTSADGATYTYDANGSPTSNGSEAITHDIDDQPIQIGTRAISWADGRMVAKGTESFAWSVHGDLLSATVGGTTRRYITDALHRRSARIEGTDVTVFHYADTARPWVLTHADGPEGLTEYFYDGYNFLIGLRRGGALYHVVTDAVGTPRFVVDESGGIVKELRHDAWGKRTLDSNPSFPLHVGFAGGLYDDLTGWVTFYVRDYDPELGRFTSIDPSLYGARRANLLGYADNDPVTNIDPTGFVTIGGNIFAGFAGGEGEISYSDGRFSYCVGVGVGVGGGAGIDFDLFGEPKNDQIYVRTETSASFAGLGVGVSTTLADIDCGDGRVFDDHVHQEFDTPDAEGIAEWAQDVYNGDVEAKGEISSKIMAGGCRMILLW